MHDAHNSETRSNCYVHVIIHDEGVEHIVIKEFQLELSYFRSNIKFLREKKSASKDLVPQI